MPGLTLGIGESNPKRGAVQYDARRIDGVPFIITDSASITSAPIGSIVTLQENTSLGQQKIVLGAAAYTDDDENLFTIIGIGFLEAATQTDDAIDQSVGYYADGDMAAMIMDPAAVGMCPMETGYNPTVGTTVYVNADGQLTSVLSGNVAFPGVVFFSTPGVQLSNQLKSGYCFARFKYVIL